jgi:fructose-1,6-bisphosphatase
VSEGNPVALLIEQAGGSASNGSERILSIQPKTLHQRTPLIFGSSDEVRRCVERLDRHPNHGSDSPLFRSRGIFRD